jgi:hypothetical protein
MLSIYSGRVLGEPLFAFVVSERMIDTSAQLVSVFAYAMRLQHGALRRSVPGS